MSLKTLVVYITLFAVLGVALSLSKDRALTSYDEVIDSLESGHLVSWNADLTQCILLGSSDSSISDSSVFIRGNLNNYERFYAPAFGTQKYLSASESKLDFPVGEISDKKPHYTISTVRMYDNSTVAFSLEYVDPLPDPTTPAEWQQTALSAWTCDMKAGMQFSTKPQSADSQLPGRLEPSLDALKAALEKGYEIRYIVHYDKCLMDGQPATKYGAAGAAVLTTAYDMTKSGDLQWNRSSMFKNYQGSGYVYDVVEATLSTKTKRVDFTASDMLTNTLEQAYEETFDCGIEGKDAAVQFYYY